MEKNRGSNRSLTKSTSNKLNVPGILTYEGFEMATAKTKKPDRFSTLNELARRRGFFWQSYEIYGGVSGFVTYGALGVKLKQNIERKLRDLFVNKLGIVEIESPIIAPEEVFKASGHVTHFNEPMVECLKCRKKYRADHLLREFAHIGETEAEKLSLRELKEAIDENELKCPECNGEFDEPKYFLTMFKTTIGPYSDAVGYGRPEAAQGIFVEFNRLFIIEREKLPFGVLQVGHALRNEISPRQGLIRLREFTIADMEIFFDPQEPDCYLLNDVKNETLRLLLSETKLKNSEEITEVTVENAVQKSIIKSEWQATFMAYAKRLLVEFGVPSEKQRFIEKLPWERAHYSSQSFDQEVYVEPWGWVEVSGHAYRSDYDLKSHMRQSGVDMQLFKEFGKPIVREKVIVRPNVAKLGPIFREDARRVAEMLSNTSPQDLEREIKEKGFYMIDKFKILPEHFTISKQETVERGRHYLPHVVEPSFGTDRLLYIALDYAYRLKNDRVILSFPRDISPMQVGVYPLVDKDGLPEKASEVRRLLVDEAFTVEVDEAGSIGRRYARADEAGVSLGITIDYDTLKNNTVTVRDRDSWRQVRNQIQRLPSLLHGYFNGKIDFEQLGEPV